MKYIIAYLLLTFAFGIYYTGYSLERDIRESTARTGRVNLLCSYFYENYNPREVLTWWVVTNGSPLMPSVVDKASAIVYGRFLGVRYGESDYVLTAYPGGLKRIDHWTGFWGVYEDRQ